MLNKMGACATDNVLGSVLCCLLVLALANPPGFAAAQESDKLKIVVLGGEGATNNIKLRLSRELMVKVEDENDNPVAGAAVVFTLPDSGAGGTFEGVGKMLAVKTNEEGVAAAQGFVPNEIVGDFKIQIQASHQGQVATASIMQTNVIVGAAAAASGGISGALLGVIIGGAVAGAVIGIKAATGGGDQPEERPSGTISVGGSPTLSPP
jgi:hypothetical protein